MSYDTPEEHQYQTPHDLSYHLEDGTPVLDNKE